MRPINDMLSSLPEVRFSMPGHKGRLDPRDITELPGADNLLSPTGCIARSQALCAEENGAAQASYSVNGSTACVLAALYGFKQKVIIAADAHRSAWNALSLSGAERIVVPVSLEFGSRLETVRAQDVVCAIEEHPDAEAVFITYPNYYGVCCDLSAIAAAAHAAKMTVVADSAHGAHLRYSPELPPDAGEAGADIWLCSYHKTLPALNQAAVLFSRRPDAALARRLALFQTTSPSYPILASIDAARELMAERGRGLLSRLLKNIEEFKQKISDLAYVEPTDDPTRLAVYLPGGGFAAEKYLWERKIAVECADANHILLICGAADEAGDLDALAAALSGFKKFDKPTRHELLLKGMPGAVIYPPGVIAPADEPVLKLLSAEGYNVISGPETDK